MRRLRLPLAALLAVLLSVSAYALTSEKETPGTKAAGGMTLDRLDKLVRAVDDKAERLPDGGRWKLRVAKVPLLIITDKPRDRMRILVGIAKVSSLDQAKLTRLMQANFDTALDARYAVARGVLFATYIHPLSPLTDKQFLSGLGQTVNLARTYGTLYSSGALTFGGGDSNKILRDLLEDLKKKGEAI